MKMRSSIVAMLWENWRLTRVEAAWKLALGSVGGLAVLALFAAIAPSDNPTRARDFGAVIALILLVMPHFVGWPSIARLNGGRPGFPLYLLYTRPVRTAVIVGLPLVYLTALPAAIYLVSALLLRAASGYPFPLLPVAAWIATLTVLLLARNWTARNMVPLMLGSAVAALTWLTLASHRLNSGGLKWQSSPELWPTIFDFPLTDYALIALIGLASFGFAVARVAQQRRGDAPAARTPGAGYPEWLVNLFRFPCPTSSAMRAQAWFDLKSSGLPVLAIGVALAIVILLLFAVSGPIDAAISAELRSYVSCSNRGCFYARAIAWMLVAVSPLIVLVLGGNIFGIRRRQGRTYVSAFEAAQACGTAQLAGLRILVRSVCVLAALIAVGVSAWASLSAFGAEVFLQVTEVPLGSFQGAIKSAVAALTAYELLALVAVASIGVCVWVATFAVLGALWTRYSRRLTISASLLLLYGLALALLALAERTGIVSEFLVDTVFAATRWVAAAAMVFTIVYLFWRGFAERVLTLRYACGAVVISAAFGVAWVTLQHATNAVWILSPLLLPLMASALAPWSLSRIRHL